MFGDIKYGLRVLAKRPAFSIVAIVTLALGIGANTAIFSVVEGALLRPLPFRQADRLVRIFETRDENGIRAASMNLSDKTVQRWRELGHDIFEGIAAGAGGAFTIGLNDGSPGQTVPAARITANFFSIVGISPVQGRGFTLEEDRASGAAVVVISDDFWRNVLNARRNVLGQTIVIDGERHTIIGVMPKSFRHPYRATLWLPLGLPPLSAAKASSHYLYGVVRLSATVTHTQAEQAVRRMCAAINQSDPNLANPRAAYLPPLRESFVTNLRPKILIIVGAAFCALLIAAANFAGLLLARVIEREGEFALRAALGASRYRLLRQQLVQASLLAAAGTALGLVLAAWATPLLFAMSPEGNDVTGSAMREFDYTARLDLPVFAFAAAVMAMIGAGFGLIPAARASHSDLRGAMGSASRTATLDRGSQRLLGSLVVIELAIAAALLTAGITASNLFRKLLNEPWGFETENRIAFNTTVPDEFFPTAAAKQNGFDTILKELRALPGVLSATMTSPSPMDASWNLIPFNPEGASVPEPSGVYMSYSRAAVPGYFKSIGQPLLQGREFLESDRPDAPLVCIISKSLARRFWPNEDPIGRRIKWGRLGDSRPWLTVVGVVGDMKAIADPNDGQVIGMIAKPVSQMLVHASAPLDDITFVIRTDHGMLSESTIRAALARADSRLAAYNIASLDSSAAQSRTTERFVFVLVSAFGALGLILAAIGLYGLLALQVALRERELGIRAALGATAKQIIQLVAKQGANLLLLGFVAGALVTSGVFRLVQSQWAEMPMPNLSAWLEGGLVLVIAAAIACWFPARRAARLDPAIVLRSE